MSNRRLEQFEILKRFFNNVDDAFLWILSESLDRNNVSDEQFEKSRQFCCRCIFANCHYQVFSW